MRRCLSLLAALLCAAGLTSCGRVSFYSAVAGDECNQHPAVAREWPSPDGKLKAVEYRTTCAGWYALTVDISGYQANAPRTAFTDRPVAQKRPPQWPDLKVEWRSDGELWITYPAGQDTTCFSTAAGLQVHCIDGTMSR